jgi:ABC-type nitrate/sulfonate/bicarbonate transport system substrate-binding protein
MRSTNGVISSARQGRGRMLLILAALLALTALVAAGCGSSGNSSGSGSTNAAGGIAGKRFVIMLQSTPSTSKVVTAHAVDLLKKQGVKAELKFNASSTNVAISELLNGNIDVYGEAVVGGIGGAIQGIPLEDFALQQPRADYVMLGKAPMATLADMKGKKIGIQDTTGANYGQLLLALQKAGLTTKDIHIVTAGGQSTRLPALVAGRVDATMLSHSAEIQLRNRGFNVLFDYTKDATELYDDNSFATKKWLAANKDLAVAWNKALMQSFVWFNDPANADAVVTEALKLAPADDRNGTKEFFDQLRAAGAYPNGSTLSLAALDAQQTLFKQAGVIQDTRPVNDWATDTYAKQAAAELGAGGTSTTATTDTTATAK